METIPGLLGFRYRQVLLHEYCPELETSVMQLMPKVLVEIIKLITDLKFKSIKIMYEICGT
jgi:hypothetical protein